MWCAYVRGEAQRLHTKASLAFPLRVFESKVNSFQLISPQCPDQLQLITRGTHFPSLLTSSPELV